MDHVHVKPSETARIRQPERGSAVMSSDGGWVNGNDPFYSQLIKNGDLIVSDPQPVSPLADRKATAPAAPVASSQERLTSRSAK